MSIRRIRRRRIGRGCALLTVAILVAAGCGSDDDKASSTDTTVAAPTTAAPTTTAAKPDPTASVVTTTTTGGTPGTTAAPGAVDPWQRTSQSLQLPVDTRATVSCPPGGTAFRVWGSGTYTDDSSICTAAVHFGLITFAQGGDVNLMTVAGQESYEGTEANGVTTSAYGAWGGSFLFPDTLGN